MSKNEDTWFGRHNITKLEERIKQLEEDVEFALDKITEIEATTTQNRKAKE